MESGHIQGYPSQTDPKWKGIKKNSAQGHSCRPATLSLPASNVARQRASIVDLAQFVSRYVLSGGSENSGKVHCLENEIWNFVLVSNLVFVGGKRLTKRM